MRIPVLIASLVENRSDKNDEVELANAMRDLLVGKAWEFKVGATTDATPLTIWSDRLGPNSCAMVEARVVAYAAGAGAGYWRRAIFRRAAGAATLVGGTTPDPDQEDVAGWDVTLEVDPAVTGGVRLVVTGAAATSISWRAEVTALVTPWQ